VVHRPPDGAGDAVRLAHIGLDGDRVAAAADDAVRRFLAARPVDLGHGNPRALAREQLGRAAADAGAGAGDEGDLALQPRHGASPVFPGTMVAETARRQGRRHGH
jgi:hypothetical protein